MVLAIGKGVLGGIVRWIILATLHQRILMFMDRPNRGSIVEA